MKKILLCLCLLFGFGYAKDKDGLFVGFELGVSEIGGTITTLGQSVNVSGNAPLYGFRAGYKQFFGDNIGLSAYLSFRNSFNTNKMSGIAAMKQTQNFRSIMGNIDALYDFYESSNVSFGVFLGIGLGSGIYKESMVENISGFYSDVKFGLNTGIDNSQVSLIAYLPITPINDTISGMKLKMKTNYAISLAYDYKF